MRGRTKNNQGEERANFKQDVRGRSPLGSVNDE